MKTQNQKILKLIASLKTKNFHSQDDQQRFVGYIEDFIRKLVWADFISYDEHNEYMKILKDTVSQIEAV